MNRIALLDSVWTWWRRWTPVPEWRAAALPVPPPTPHVAGRYLSLYTYLEHRYATNVVLTFDEMESVLGFALPAPARSEREWWTSPTDDLDQHSDAWTVACRTATPNLLARTVAFERVL